MLERSKFFRTDSKREKVTPFPLRGVFNSAGDLEKIAAPHEARASEVIERSAAVLKEHPNPQLSARRSNLIAAFYKRKRVLFAAGVVAIAMNTIPSYAAEAYDADEQEFTRLAEIELARQNITAPKIKSTLESSIEIAREVIQKRADDASVAVSGKTRAGVEGNRLRATASFTKMIPGNVGKISRFIVHGEELLDRMNRNDSSVSPAEAAGAVLLFLADLKSFGMASSVYEVLKKMPVRETGTFPSHAD